MVVVVLSGSVMADVYTTSAEFRASDPEVNTALNSFPVSLAEYDVVIVHNISALQIQAFITEKSEGDFYILNNGIRKQSGITGYLLVYNYPTGVWQYAYSEISVSSTLDETQKTSYYIDAYPSNINTSTIRDLFANSDIYTDETLSTVFFSPVASMSQVVTESLEAVNPTRTLSGISLPLVTLLVGSLGLRKGLTFFQTVLRGS